MELPFIVVFEPPSQEELRDVLRMRGTWVAGLIVVLAIGTGLLLWDVRLLSGGDLALMIALPGGQEVQAWRVEPRTGALRPVLSDAMGTRLAVAPDGLQVAFVGYEVGPVPFGSNLTGYGFVHAG